MAVVAIATLDELTVRLGVELDPETTAGVRGQTCLDDATLLARAAAGIADTDEEWADAPEIAKMIVLRAAVRGMSTVEGATPDVSLTSEELEIFRRLNSHSMHSLELESGYGLRSQFNDDDLTANIQ